MISRTLPVDFSSNVFSAWMAQFLIYIYMVLLFFASGTPAYRVRNKNLSSARLSSTNFWTKQNSTWPQLLNTMFLELLAFLFGGMFQKHLCCTGFCPQDPAKNNQRGHKINISNKENSFWDKNHQTCGFFKPRVKHWTNNSTQKQKHKTTKPETWFNLLAAYQASYVFLWAHWSI